MQHDDPSEPDSRPLLAEFGPDASQGLHNCTDFEVVDGQGSDKSHAGAASCTVQVDDPTAYLFRGENVTEHPLLEVLPCETALGMESGGIADNQLDASSGTPAGFGRLNGTYTLLYALTIIPLSKIGILDRHTLELAQLRLHEFTSCLHVHPSLVQGPLHGVVTDRRIGSRSISSRKL